MVNQAWAVDFVQHHTEDGKRLKILTVVDEYSREALAVEVARTMSHKDVFKVLVGLIVQRGAPELVRSDNGSEFIAKGIQQALLEQGVESAFIAPGSPWQNGKNERFNGLLGQEELDRETYCSLAEARVMIEAYRRDYNGVRPHSAIGYMSPDTFAQSQRERGAWWQPPLKLKAPPVPAPIGSAPLRVKADTDGDGHLPPRPS